MGGRGHITGWSCWVGVGGTSKQTTTMPDVAVRWLCSLLSTLGGNLGWDILYLGPAGVDTPIWDVLAPRGKQEGVGEHLRMSSRCPAFLIKQAVPVQLGLAFGCIWQWLWVG